MDTPSFPKLSATDKKFALGILAVLLIGGFVALPWLLLLMAMLVELAQNTIIFLVELAVGVLLLMNAQNIYYGFMNLSRAVSRFIIRKDPVGTLDTAIGRMQKKQEEVSQALADSAASQKRLKNRIQNPMRDGALDHAEAEEQLAMTAKTKGRPETEIAQHAVAADRWRRTAGTFQPMLERLSKMQDMLNKAKELADSSLADLQSQRDVLKVQLEAEKDGQKAVGAFKRFFGRSAEGTMAAMSIEEIERQTTQAEAEIEQFLTAIGSKLDEQDLKKQSSTDAAMARFEVFADKKLLPVPAEPAVIVKTPVKDGIIVNRS